MLAVVAIQFRVSLATPPPRRATEPQCVRRWHLRVHSRLRYLGPAVCGMPERPAGRPRLGLPLSSHSLHQPQPRARTPVDTRSCLPLSSPHAARCPCSTPWHTRRKDARSRSYDHTRTCPPPLSYCLISLPGRFTVAEGATFTRKGPHPDSYVAPAGADDAAAVEGGSMPCTAWTPRPVSCCSVPNAVALHWRAYGCRRSQRQR